MTFLNDLNVDFPKINLDYLSRKNRYGYASIFPTEITLPKFR